MKKKLVIFVAVAIILAAPSAVRAFSFGDVVNLGKKLFQVEVAPVVTPKNEVSIPTQPTEVGGLSAEKKYENWQDAYEQKDLASVLSDDRNLYFTDGELSYLTNEELSNADNPVAKDVSFSFSDDLAQISGYLTMKNFSGSFYLEAVPAVANGKASLKVTRARFNNFYFPAAIAQMILKGQIEQAINFLYSNAEYQNLKFSLGSGFIELDYVD
jgi:hypothetical protein